MDQAVVQEIGHYIKFHPLARGSGSPATSDPTLISVVHLFKAAHLRYFYQYKVAITYPYGDQLAHHAQEGFLAGAPNTY